MPDIEYEIIYSGRKSVGISVKPDGKIIVRAPYCTTEAYLKEVVTAHSQWIENAVRRVENRKDKFSPPDEDEEKRLRKEAKRILYEKVRYYGDIIGVSPTGITITGAKSRFGSCSGKNRISFSFYLMRYPEDAVDYVVVHELCHILHHDHSKEFYKEIEKIFPDYKRREALLRK